MILFPRVVAQNFRVLFTRCIAGRPRGPAPPVVIQIAESTHTITATTPDGVILTYTAPAPKGINEFVVLPAAVLGAVEGGTDESVILDRPSKLRGVMRWQVGGEARTLPVELILPGKQHAIPLAPPLASVPAKLLAAVHECGRTTARENGRYALAMMQLQGRAGRVIGTDSKIALVWSGFSFPFTEDVLVPAVPVFGAKPLARIPEVKIGRTATQLIVAVGPWAVWLPTNTTAKYPDVVRVIPKYAPTTVSIDAVDATELLRVLPGLPSGDDEMRPVTIDADRVLRVRGRGESGEVKEVTMALSPSTGPVIQLALDRRALARGLMLGCHTLKLTPNKPIMMQGKGVVLVATQLEPDLVVSRSIAAVTTPTPDCVRIPATFNNLERITNMKPLETNGHTPPRGDPADPLEIAEELRAQLANAATNAARLVAALRYSRKEKKALANVLTNLKQLNLGNGGVR